MKIEQRKRTAVESAMVDGSILVGASLVSYGAWAIYTPAGFIVAGMLLLAFGVTGARQQ